MILIIIFIAVAILGLSFLIARHKGRKFDKWDLKIIAVMAVIVVLVLFIK